MKILLFNPSWGGWVSGGRYNRRWFPLDLLNVAAILPGDGHAVGGAKEILVIPGIKAATTIAFFYRCIAGFVHNHFTPY